MYKSFLDDGETVISFSLRAGLNKGDEDANLLASEISIHCPTERVAWQILP